MSHRLNDPKYLIGHWPCNGHIQDVSGYNRHGTWVGAEGYVDDQHGRQIADFPAGPYINIGDLGLGAGDDWSLVCWMYCDALDVSRYGYVLGVATSVGLWFDGWQSGWNGIGMYFGSTLINYGSGDAGRWYHAVMTKQGSTYTLYIDGKFGTSGIRTASGISDLSIANRSGSVDPWDGKIGGVRAYNIVLTLDEAKALFLQPVPRRLVAQQPIAQAPDLTDSKLKGAWLNKLVINSAKDATPNGFDFALVGAPTMGKVGASFVGASSQALRATSRIISAFPFEFEAWIKTGTADGTVIGMSDSGSNFRHQRLYVASGKARAYSETIGTAVSAESTTDVDDDAWHHLVAQFASAASRKIFVDGVEEDEETTSVGFDANMNRTHIGRSEELGGDIFFTGEIRDAQCRSAISTDAEILRRARAGVPDPTLVLQVMGDGKDRSRFGHVLGLNGGVGLGRRMKFNGSTDWLHEGVTDWRINDSQGTIMAWVKFSTLGAYRTIFSSSRLASSTQHVYLRISNANDLQFVHRSVGAATVLVGSTVFVAERWYHVALTSDGAVYRMYVNGVAETLSGTNDGHWFADTTLRTNVRIGSITMASGDFYFFHGEMDAVKVFSEEKAAAWLREYVLRTRNFL